MSMKIKQEVLLYDRFVFRPPKERVVYCLPIYDVPADVRSNSKGG